ncbi:MAG: 4Fe-4S cluster-binding domain-containing protein [Bacteroidaceae bacterium]|nr:4Fe-4S cluster-binding domain-containing protein [Bacteroidaceae bacterium]
MLRIIDIIHDTTVDGPGFRTSIYAAGCRHGCEGCHNPESWPRWGGREVSIGEVLMEILSDPFADVTFSGGDPFFQAAEFARLARLVRRDSKKTIWCYTGFLFERLYEAAFLRRPIPQGSKLASCDIDAVRTLIENLDVMVDGPFVNALRNTDLLFRGSSNQRIIDVRASLAQGAVVLWERR